MMIEPEWNRGIERKVYNSLLGYLIPEQRLDWVENIFEPGKPAHEAYVRMRKSYDCLLERLDEVDEDLDVERIIDGLLDYSEVVALEMFAYGRKYQKMVDEQEKSGTTGE